MVENTAAGAGSIWNKNSWHWEDKNYTKVAEEFLRKQIPEISYKESSPACLIKLYDIKSIKGSAQVTIRKQKSIFLYEFDIDIYFKAVSEAEGEEEVKGQIYLKEVNQDDDELDLTTTCENPSDFASAVKRSIQKKLSGVFLETLNALKAHCLQLESDQKKIQQDLAQRKQAEEEAKKASEASGELKEQIFQEQKRKEQELKEETKKNVPQKVDPPQKVEGQGSVWNTGNYFWEEKDVGKWGKLRLQEVLGGFTHSWKGGVLRITEVKELEGDCSASIRKGKKLITYDFKAKLNWASEKLDDVGKACGPFCNGRFELIEFSNDCGEDIDDWEVKTYFGEDMDGWKSASERTIKNDASTALKKHILNTFVKELKEK